jgi:hypothetical protein
MTSTITSRRKIGRLLISLVAVLSTLTPYLADWNVTHIYNPTWPPHAKFHNAQTLVLGTILSFLCIYCLWFRKGITEPQKLNEGTVLASLNYLAQMLATLFPGTGLTDHGLYGVKMPIVFGIEFNQLTFVTTVIVPLIALGYYLENRSLKKADI